MISPVLSIEQDESVKNEAEAKIEKLTKNQKGELATELFPVEDEDDAKD